MEFFLVIHQAFIGLLLYTLNHKGDWLKTTHQNSLPQYLIKMRAYVYTLILAFSLCVRMDTGVEKKFYLFKQSIPEIL